MVECGKENDESVVAVLLFGHKELCYDIANLAYTEGHIMVEADDEIRHTLQDIVEEGNRDRVERILDMEYCVITELLYPYTHRPITEDHLHNRQQKRHVSGIRLVLPKNFSQTTLNLMERLIHEDFVCSVVYDWLTITNPQKSQIWREKRDEVRTKLKRCVNSRRGKKRVRIRMHPF